jgi:DNA primase
LDFVANMVTCSIREAARELQDRFGIHNAEPFGNGTPSLAEQPRPECRPGEAFRKDDSASNSPLPFVLSRLDVFHPYISQRGITQETAQEFGIGFYPGRGLMQGRIVIPVHNDQGVLIAYVGRSLDSSEPKYKFPPRFRKSLALFNLHRAVAAAADRVILVEGFFDCMKVHQAGYPSVVALMGSSLSTRQEKLLEDHFQEVLLMLDGDAAGISAAATIGARLMRKLSVNVAKVPSGRQPDQMSADEIRLLPMQPIYR